MICTNCGGNKICSGQKLDNKFHLRWTERKKEASFHICYTLTVTIQFNRHFLLKCEAFIITQKQSLCGIGVGSTGKHMHNVENNKGGFILMNVSLGRCQFILHFQVYLVYYVIHSRPFLKCKIYLCSHYSQTILVRIGR